MLIDLRLNLIEREYTKPTNVRLAKLIMKIYKYVTGIPTGDYKPTLSFGTNLNSVAKDNGNTEVTIRVTYSDGSYSTFDIWINRPIPTYADRMEDAFVYNQDLRGRDITVLKDEEVTQELLRDAIDLPMNLGENDIYYMLSSVSTNVVGEHDCYVNLKFTPVNSVMQQSISIKVIVEE